MNAIDKVFMISNKELMIYFKSGKNFTLYSAHGQVLMLLDWFIAPRNFNSATKALEYEQTMGTETQTITLKAV